MWDHDFETKLGWLADDALETMGTYHSYDDKALFHATMILQEVLMAKLWERQEALKMPQAERELEATAVGSALRSLLLTYTGIDTHQLAQL